MVNKVTLAVRTSVAGACTDVKPPTSGFTCAQQAGFGKCGTDFMVGYCDLSCRRCANAAGVRTHATFSGTSQVHI